MILYSLPLLKIWQRKAPQYLRNKATKKKKKNLFYARTDLPSVESVGRAFFFFFLEAKLTLKT